jgi:predicted nucleotidyltransferase
MNKETILQKLQELKPQYEKDGLSIVGLFGSFSKDQDDKFSDIDIAYRIDHKLFSKKFKDGFSKILKIEDIKYELEKVFQRRVDLISLNSNNKRFIEKVNQELIHV